MSEEKTNPAAEAPAIETSPSNSANEPTARASAAPAPVKRKPSESSRLRAAAVRASKLDAIANRRATAAKMGKAEFIAEIVKGRFKPITAEEIAAEPTPVAATAAAAT